MSKPDPTARLADLRRPEGMTIRAWNCMFHGPLLRDEATPGRWRYPVTIGDLLAFIEEHGTTWNRRVPNVGKKTKAEIEAFLGIDPAKPTRCPCCGQPIPAKAP